MIALRRRRDAADLCLRCGAPRDTRLHHCSNCLMSLARRRARRVAFGKCQHCRRIRDRGKKVLCSTCASSGAAKFQQKLKSRRLLGRCTSCGRERDRPGKKVCFACSERNIRTVTRLYKLYRANRLCWRCGVPTNGPAYCRECIHKNRIGLTKRRPRSAIQVCATNSRLNSKALHSSDQDNSAVPAAQFSATDARDGSLTRKEEPKNDRRLIVKLVVANRYKRFKVNHICPRCCLPHDSEHVLCDKCHERVTTANLALQKTRRAQNLCLSCRGNRDDETAWCINCRRIRIKRKHAVVRMRLERNLCGFCGGTKDRGRNCADCRSMFAAYARNERRERRAAGLCTICGKKAPDTGRTSCRDCREKVRPVKENYARKKRNERAHAHNRFLPPDGGGLEGGRCEQQQQ